MIRLTGDQVRELLACPRLGPLQRRVVHMRYVDGMRTNDIAQRTGLAPSTVTSALTVARRRIGVDERRSTRIRFRKGSNRYGGAPLDQAWFDRNVAAIKACIGGDEHQYRYLRCIEYLWGEDMRKRMAIAAGIE